MSLSQPNPIARTSKSSADGTPRFIAHNLLPARKDAGEFYGRCLLCVALPLLPVFFWTAVESSPHGPKSFNAMLTILNLERLSFFAAAMIGGALLSPVAKSRNLILIGALTFGFGFIWTRPQLADTAVSAGVLGFAREWLRLETVFFSAVLLGVAAGRSVSSAAGWTSLLICAAVGDGWLHWLAYNETVSGVSPPLERTFFSLTAERNLHGVSNHPLRFLQLSPTLLLELQRVWWTDLFFAAAVTSGAMRLRLSAASVSVGAALGWLASGFIAAVTSAGSPHAFNTMPALWAASAGALTTGWDELRLTRRALAPILFTIILLSALMAGVGLLQRSLLPEPPRPSPETASPRIAQKSEKGRRDETSTFV